LKKFGVFLERKTKDGGEKEDMKKLKTVNHDSTGFLEN